MRDENIITWNLPNLVTIILMVALLWTGVGIVSHMVRGKVASTPKGIVSDSSGNVVNG